MITPLCSSLPSLEGRDGLAESFGDADRPHRIVDRAMGRVTEGGDAVLALVPNAKVEGEARFPDLAHAHVDEQRIVEARRRFEVEVRAHDHVAELADRTNPLGEAQIPEI